MWPWEHLAVGYVLYSLYSHLRYRHPPTSGTVFVAVVATQIPDLIDKTLAWGLHVLPSGHSLGHSLLFAVPLSLLVGLLAWRTRRAPVGVAFALGYLSHLPADLVYPFLTGGRTSAAFLFWPLLPGPPYDPNQSFLTIVGRYFTEYVHGIATGEVTTYFLLQTAFLLAVFVLWLYDGAPLLSECSALLRPSRSSE